MADYVDDGTEAAFAYLTNEQRAALLPTDERLGPDGAGTRHRSWGVLPTEWQEV